MAKKYIIPQLFKFLVCITLYTINSTWLFAQNSESKYLKHANALLNVIVEPYYTATKYDIEIDSTLNKKTTAYRLYIVLQEGYELQAIYGSENHPLFIETSTTFYNCNTYNYRFGRKIPDSLLNKGTLLLDSWLTIGSTANSQIGVPLSADTNGSCIQRKELRKADGMLPGETINIILYGLNYDCVIKNNISKLQTTNGLWALPKGYATTPKNTILIAQLTTDGQLSFALNLQVVAPNGDIIQFVANDAVVANEIQSNKLKLLFN